MPTDWGHSLVLMVAPQKKGSCTCHAQQWPPGQVLNDPIAQEIAEENDKENEDDNQSSPVGLLHSGSCLLTDIVTLPGVLWFCCVLP